MTAVGLKAPSAFQQQILASTLAVGDRARNLLDSNSFQARDAQRQRGRAFVFVKETAGRGVASAHAVGTAFLELPSVGLALGNTEAAMCCRNEAASRLTTHDANLLANHGNATVDAKHAH